MRWISVLIVGALLVSVTWWKISHRSPSSDQAYIAHSSPVIDAGPAAVSPRRKEVTADQPIGSQSPENVESGKLAQQAAVDGVVQAGRTKLTAQYQTERVDGSWAITREQSLVAHGTSAQIESVNARPKNLVAHCRTSVCRVAADFASRVVADDWLTLYVTNQGTDLSRVTYEMTPNPDNGVHVEIYGLAR